MMAAVNWLCCPLPCPGPGVWGYRVASAFGGGPVPIGPQISPSVYGIKEGSKRSDSCCFVKCNVHVVFSKIGHLFDKWSQRLCCLWPFWDCAPHITGLPCWARLTCCDGRRWKPGPLRFSSTALGSRVRWINPHEGHFTAERALNKRLSGGRAQPPPGRPRWRDWKASAPGS